MPLSLLPARWADEQVPEGDQIFLDHVAHFVGDLDQAAIALRRLGFEPSPINLQENVGDSGIARPSGTVGPTGAIKPSRNGVPKKCRPRHERG